MSEEIEELLRERADLRSRVNAVRKRSDGVPPLATWAKSIGEGMSDMLRDPDEEKDVEELRKGNDELRTWLNQNE